MKEKIAVSLPSHLVEAARSAVRRGRAGSVSAYVADAMKLKAQGDSLAEALDDLDRDLGPPTAEEEAWARSVLGL